MKLMLFAIRIILLPVIAVYLASAAIGHALVWCFDNSYSHSAALYSYESMSEMIKTFLHD